MSIIMKAAYSPITADAVKPDLLDSPTRELLDHLAVELAAEYIRLMEAAADAEIQASPPLRADN